jgi:hypothetical protein
MGCIVVLNIALTAMVIVSKRKAAKTMTMSKTTQGELKMVKIVLLVVAVLFATWIPTTALTNLLLDRLQTGRGVSFALLVVFHMSRGFTFIGTVADPFIYFTNNAQFRNAVLALFGVAKDKRLFILRPSTPPRRLPTPREVWKALGSTKNKLGLSLLELCPFREEGEIECCTVSVL